MKRIRDAQTIFGSFEDGLATEKVKAGTSLPIYEGTSEGTHV